MSSSFLSLWPANTILEKNDDYETYESIHRQQIQQANLKHQGQEEQIENYLYHSTIGSLVTGQMVDNINTGYEQRPFTGGGGGAGSGANNNNIVNHKRAKNGKTEK